MQIGASIYDRVFNSYLHQRLRTQSMQIGACIYIKDCVQGVIFSFPKKRSTPSNNEYATRGSSA